MKKQDSTNKASEAATFYPPTAAAWRQWLKENHDKVQSVWLIYYKKNSGKPTVLYSDAVDEALCFGWIDSRARPIDEEKFMQFFSRRKPTSVWSRINKEKVDRLIAEGRMEQAGYNSIAVAKANGSWTILDDAEALIIPPDLEKAFKPKPKAKAFFLNLSRSDKRNILQWLVLARRPETRLKRIQEIVALAAKQQKPKQFGG